MATTWTRGPTLGQAITVEMGERGVVLLVWKGGEADASEGEAGPG